VARNGEVDGAGGTRIQGGRGQISSSPSGIWRLWACRRNRRRRRWAGPAAKVGTLSFLPLHPPRLSFPCGASPHETGRLSYEFGAKNSPVRDPSPPLPREDEAVQCLGGSSAWPRATGRRRRLARRREARRYAGAGLFCEIASIQTRFTTRCTCPNTFFTIIYQFKFVPNITCVLGLLINVRPTN
jgi:hypothetical protein